MNETVIKILRILAVAFVASGAGTLVVDFANTGAIHPDAGHMVGSGLSGIMAWLMKSPLKPVS